VPTEIYKAVLFKLGVPESAIETSGQVLGNTSGSINQNFVTHPSGSIARPRMGDLPPAAQDRNRICRTERIRYNPLVCGRAQQPLSARPGADAEWRYRRKHHQYAGPKP
jgi:hypothetical protein